ncbi:tyrosine-type recombinase/integrase [Bradyrhizobium sp. JYMT SZCCT0428]|uniref:tyrosine-type recombinase/integrase n=1 Tax=Bradyrhizobium sp. JYMT SZCCT0428 TaxID=2807673 RepID=UPI001BAB8EC9|nr:tyrosine-type recombinase/integrase [Bradyrhizobium sp. JYMT SZCCT0428]MBR1155892.1 site-specific integrase [Bradyrhizobium sp. JYMT SZCCT0428]
MKGHIRERSPGHWAIVFDVPDPKTGKRRRKWYSFKGTKRQAQVESARLISEFKSGNALEPTKTTVSEYLEKWLEYIRTQVSPRTFERYGEIVRKNISPLIGTIQLTKLSPMAISTAYSTALTSGRRKGSGGLSPRTVHHCHRVLKQALTQAVRWQLMGRSPADSVDPPKVERTAMTTYDLKQTGELIEALRGTCLFIPTLLAVLLGMRRGEIAALRWRSVSLETAQLAVVESVEQMNSAVRLKPPKNGRARTVALGRTIVEELRAYRLTQAQGLLKLGVRLSDDNFVCAHADGEMMEPVWITREWARVIRGTGLPRYRFHDLRHAHATHLLASGTHPKVASERLGHSKIGITLDLYSHVMPGMQEDAAARADAALRAAKSTNN